jgi:outer membrane protein
MRYRLLVLLLVSLLPVPLFARDGNAMIDDVFPPLPRGNEIGIFVNRPTFQQTTRVVFPLFEDATLNVHPKIGYGVSFNHFVSRNLSLQVSAQTVRGNARLETAGGVHFTDSAGTLDLKQYDAAVHWNFVPEGPVRPYVGGGIAWIGGGKLQIAADAVNGVHAGAISLDNKVTWLVAGGVDFRISKSAAITLEAKFTQYSSRGARNRAASVDPSNVLFGPLNLNPMTASAGMRWHF